MKNRLKQFLIIIAVICLWASGSSTYVKASETVITLDGNATSFSKVEQDLDFQDMEPGEERTAVISLENQSEEEMRFYLNGEIVYNIADAAKNNRNAIYELTLTNGDEKEPFFTGVFGSADNTKVDSKKQTQYLSEDTMLASLQKNENVKITMTLTLDGDSTENDYMNTAGTIRLHVGTSQNMPQVAADEDQIKNPIIQYIEVLTGDHHSTVMWICALLLSGFLLSTLFFYSKKYHKKAAKNTGKLLVFLIAGSAMIAAHMTCGQTQALAASKDYDVEFRAGSHGKYGEASKATVVAAYNTNLTYVPEPDQIDSGFYFTGYTPVVNEKVTENAVYVAQYARLVDAVQYRVNYVDAEGNSLSTQKVAYANGGDTIVAYAPKVDGYNPDAASKQVSLTGTDAQITFVYTITPNTTGNQGQVAADEEPATEIVYVYRTADGEVVPSQEESQVVTQENQNENSENIQTVNEEQTVAEVSSDTETETKKAEVAADEENVKAQVAADETVVSENVSKKTKNLAMMICIGIASCGVLILAGVGVYELVKMRKLGIKKDK